MRTHVNGKVVLFGYKKKTPAPENFPAVPSYLMGDLVEKTRTTKSFSMVCREGVFTV